jgi:hypothetical protein
VVATGLSGMSCAKRREANGARAASPFGTGAAQRAMRAGHRRQQRGLVARLHRAASQAPRSGARPIGERRDK